jgi:hypothetical protein
MHTMNIHGVTKIELTRHMPENGNSRTIRVTDTDGCRFELTLFGDTNVLDALPRSDGFRVYQTLASEAA